MYWPLIVIYLRTVCTLLHSVLVYFGCCTWLFFLYSLLQGVMKGTSTYVDACGCAHSWTLCVKSPYYLLKSSLGVLLAWLSYVPSCALYKHSQLLLGFVHSLTVKVCWGSTKADIKLKKNTKKREAQEWKIMEISYKKYTTYEQLKKTWAFLAAFGTNQLVHLKTLLQQ